jgi:hypothetical protein
MGRQDATRHQAVSRMGRITPSWRTIYHRQLFRLQKRKGFYHTLRAKAHQKAFNTLLKAWICESAALSNANILLWGAGALNSVRTVEWGASRSTRGSR